MTDKPKLVVIFGINSRQGSSVARYLMGKTGLRIRGVTHDGACDASQFWADNGIQIIEIKEPQKQKEALRLVVADASAIFLMTDYFNHYLNDHSIATLAGILKDDVHYHAAEREHLDGEAIVDIIEYEVGYTAAKKSAMLAAANDEPNALAKETLVECANKIPELRRLVLSSMSYPNRNPVQLWNKLPQGRQQFRVKAQIWEHLCWECPHLAFRTIRLNPALRMEDWTDFLQLQPNGRFVFGTTLPADFEIPWMHFANDTGTLFHLCLQQRPGLMLAAVSDTRSGVEICDFVTKITGKPCDYVQYTAQTLVQLLGPERGQVVVDMLAYLESEEWYDDVFVHTGQHLIEAKNATEKYKLTKMEGYMTAELPGFLEEKGWDGLFDEGEDELFDQDWQWLNDRPPLPQEDLGHLLGPLSETIDERRVMKTWKSSKTGGTETLPQKPIMEPFTPPSARAEASNVQRGESSMAMGEEMRRQSFHPRRTESLDQFLGLSHPDCDKPIPSIEVEEQGGPSAHPRHADSLNEDTDLVDPDHNEPIPSTEVEEHGSSSSHSRRANTPDQVPNRLVSPEIIDLRSGSSSKQSSPFESRAHTPNIGEQQLEHDASVQPSDIDMQDQDHGQVSSHEIIDLCSSASSTLSPPPESEPATSETDEQGQELDVPVHSSDADIEMLGQDQGWASSGLSSPVDLRTPTPETAAPREEHTALVQHTDLALRVPDHDQVSSGLSSADSRLTTPETASPHQEHDVSIQLIDVDMKEKGHNQDQASSQPPPAAELGPIASEAGEQRQEHDTPVQPTNVNVQGQDQNQGQASAQPLRADSPDTAARKFHWSTVL